MADKRKLSLEEGVKGFLELVIAGRVIPTPGPGRVHHPYQFPNWVLPWLPLRPVPRTTVEELLAERLEDARTELMEALKLADRHHLSEAHRNIGQIVLAVDDEQARLIPERSTEHV